MTQNPPRESGESLKAWKRRCIAIRAEQTQVNKREAKRQRGLYRRARLVYDEIDRSPDSDPYAIELPSF